MIYDSVDPAALLRQGDIFEGLPRLEISLRRVQVASESGDKLVETSWEDAASGGKPLALLVPAERVRAIVATQDCDLARSRDVTLCEIRPFAEVDMGFKENRDTPSKRMKFIRRQSRLSQRWFYLPADAKFGFTEPMAVDFHVTLRLPRADLVAFTRHRLGRLNYDADEHFRERLSEFFRRYPYDEWYPFTREEFNEYRRECGDAEPKPWQK